MQYEHFDKRGIPRMKWWGWGNPDFRYRTADRPLALAYLKEKLGLEKLEVHPAPKTSGFRFAEPKDKMKLVDLVTPALDPARVSSDELDLLHHSFGKSYPDLIRARNKVIDHPPDLVLYPENEEEIGRLYRLAGKYGIKVIPFGGGTSVVGGLELSCCGEEPRVVVDLGLIAGLCGIDERSRIAELEAGIRGPDLERKLNERGFTLGHYPQSFEYSSLGGWLAARSSGQNSLGYGRIEDMALSLRLVSPRGSLDTFDVPAAACGPEMKQLIIGSEGLFGIITKAKMRIRPLPEHRRYEAYFFSSFIEASEVARAIVQSGLRPVMIRVSDEAETESMLALGMHGSTLFVTLFSALKNRYLTWRGFNPKRLSMMMIGFEGTNKEISLIKSATRKILKSYTSLSLGTMPGRSWLDNRFLLPYLRDEFIDNGLMIDTFETATVWSNLFRLYHGTREAAQAIFDRQGIRGVLYAHISHLYETGASLYFTFIARRSGAEPIVQWSEIKKAVSEAVIDHGGVISHHHGIGTDHKSYLHLPELHRDGLIALKKTFDPDGISNPGKLIP